MKLDVSALNDLAIAKKVPFETVASVVQSAIADAYAKTPSAVLGATVNLDTRRGEITVLDPDGADVTPGDFSRLAATTMRQAVVMWVRDLERRAKLGTWADREGTLVTGRIRAHAARNARGETIIDLGGGVEGVMPVGEATPGEELRHGQEVTAYVVAVNPDDRSRVRVTVSRRQPSLVAALVESQSPEVKDGRVEVITVARDPGVRSKVAVRGVNAMAAVVGAGGYRMRAVAAALGQGEKVDVVVHPGTVEGFVAASLTPARVTSVVADPDVPNAFLVTVPADQVGIANGVGGKNARLAAKLTGARITIVVG